MYWIMPILPILPLLSGWILDLIFADPARLPHPVVFFGKCISFFEKRFNRGAHCMLKGAFVAIGLIAATYLISYALFGALDGWPIVKVVIEAIAVFYCLAGTTLAREVRMVFEACERSLDEGRRQVGRIVGRDTAHLSKQEVRTAALETLAENLSDGVVAPLFWYMLAGIPGMLAYKMVNTLDSMIGYRTSRYRQFGCFAARIDDVANYIPARLTAVLMALSSGTWRTWRYIFKYGSCHASPNSGYPEAALAGALDCRFGGPHDYFGECVDKPYIGDNERELTISDMRRSIRINRMAETMMVIITLMTIVLFR